MINKDQFIENCKNSGNFNWYQLYEIRVGLEDGLTIDQVKVYADSKFNDNQMCQIRYGFYYDDLTMEQIKIYANPKFDDLQMSRIREGFEEGLTIEQVTLYASPEFNVKQMQKIREFIKDNKDISINTLKFLIQLEVL